MSKHAASHIAPWYLVLEAWHPVPHFGLDGFAWPLPPEHPASRELRVAMAPLPLSPGGCLFEACFDAAAAERYFQAACSAGLPAYLIAVAESTAPLDAVSGYDVGRPEGGFSIAGQEVCKSLEAFRRFGHLVNQYGLFKSAPDLSSYLEERDRRVEADGLEYLDECVEVAISLLRRAPDPPSGGGG